MRRFHLVRREDVSGVSGVGVVAEGVEWTNGMVTLSWLGTHHSIETVLSMHTIEAIHGHHGRTVIAWVEEE